MHNPLMFCVEMPSCAFEMPEQSQPRLWQPGTLLHVRFLDGAPTLHARVAEAAREWLSWADVRFWFGDSPVAEIRVTFAGDGLWSYIGTDALRVPQEQPTMGLGVLTPQTDDATLHSVVLHMFGHALGFTHEHQNPSAHVPWDRDKLYAYFARTYGWTEAQVSANILARYDADVTNYSVFDPRSVMLMPIPRDLTVGGFEVGWNRGLSETDKSFAARIYPLSEAYALPGAMASSGDFESTEVDTGKATSGDAPASGVTGSDGSKYIVEVGSGGAAVGWDANAPATPRPLHEEKIRLDVATPTTVLIGEAFDLAVTVRQRDAPPLAVEDLPAVTSEEGTVYRADAEELIRYRIEVTGADCEVKPSHYVILLRPGENAKARFFKVTSHKAGTQTLFVNAFQVDDALAAQTRVRIEVRVPVQEQPKPTSTRTEVINVMDIVLTPAEMEQFHKALLDAFDRGDLKQVVFFGLEVDFDDIVSGNNLKEQVFNLILWATRQNQVERLLRAAMDKNPGNVELRQFDADIRAKRQGAPTAPTGTSADPFRGLKGQLLDELTKLAVTESDAGRTSLLYGIPGTDTFSRNPGIKRLDLDLILTQLAQRGRMANGELPLVKFIDNALPYATGFEGEGKLRSIQQTIAQG